MMANWLLPFTLDATEGRLETLSLTPMADPWQQGARIGPTGGNTKFPSISRLFLRWRPKSIAKLDGGMAGLPPPL